MELQQFGLLPARVHYRKGVGRVVRELSAEEYLRPVKTEGYGLRSSRYHSEEPRDGLLAGQKWRDQFGIPGYGPAIFGRLALFNRRRFVRMERSALFRQAAFAQIARSDDDCEQEQLRL